jgi:hypothetical protein
MFVSMTFRLPSLVWILNSDTDLIRSKTHMNPKKNPTCSWTVKRWMVKRRWTIDNQKVQNLLICIPNRDSTFSTLVHRLTGLHETAEQGVKGMIWLFYVCLTEKSVNRKCVIKDGESLSVRKEWNYSTVREDLRRFEIWTSREISISAQSNSNLYPSFMFIQLG